MLTSAVKSPRRDPEARGPSMIAGPTYKDEDECRGISGEKRKVEKNRGLRGGRSYFLGPGGGVGFFLGRVSTQFSMNRTLFPARPPSESSDSKMALRWA